jgi:signal transduction histidine kinase/CheY-like chemotaxis protein
MATLRSRVLHTSLGVAAVYALIGGLWILLSDRVLLSLVPDPGRYAQVQTWKGWFYVLVTTGLLFALVHRALLALGRAEEELRQREESLRQAQKMEAVGRLAGGVAHDFNNILMVIQGHADLLDAELEEGDPGRADLEQIRQAADRAALLTRQLLTFSRKRPLRPEVVDLSGSVQAAESMLRRLIGEQIRVEVDLDSRPAWVLVDPVQVEQVLLNLALNARDAMPEGGRFRLRTRRVPALEVPDPILPVEHVLLEVADEGVGMEDHVRRQAFEPFFTTKDTGKGTGLGLSTVYGVVEQAKGRVVVESTVGTGSTFRLWFPLASAPSDLPSAHRSGRPGARGGERILVVEDEVGVGDLLERVLRGAGYEVLRASDGVEALSIVEGREERIDLLLTDVIMPRMDGRTLVSRLLLRRPALPVLYLSGYAEGEGPDPPLADAVDSFVEKPVEPAELLARVRRRLDAADPR